MVGTRLGPYDVVGPLGAGGMGEVYRARDPRLERDVALKVLPPASLADATARARLVREARMAARLNHPNVCTIYEVGEADGHVYIAMELVQGRPLDELLAEPLPHGEALRYGTQIASALAHAHARGVVHRDLKGANVVITPEGQAKVLDFGLAKPLAGEAGVGTGTVTRQTLTEAGSVTGTLAYMAPEQLRGHAADARSDIWALGVVCYEMALGRRPFRGATPFALSAAILHDAPPPLPASVPAALASVIERCLMKEPGERYQQAFEVQAALESGEAGATQERESGRARARAVKLAVLPFANLSGNPEQDYLSDGLTQEMIAQLGRLHPASLGVIARASVMRYKKTDLPIEQIARELDVDYLLEGSTQREGARVHITADLVEVQGQSVLWSDSFERESSGIMGVQRDVARNVARALALALLPAEQAQLATGRPVNAEAYDLYLKGSQLWIRLTKPDLDAAEQYFELAIAKQPDYAAAHTGLALVWVSRQQMGFAPPSEAAPKAKAAAAKAVELDSGLAEAHFVRAGIKTFTDWNFAEAEADWRRALDLNPNLAEARVFYSHYLAIMKRPGESSEAVERALLLDPFNPLLRAMHGMQRLFVGQYEDALATFEALPEGFRDAGLWYTHAMLGHDTEAAAALRAFLRGMGDGALEEAFERGWQDGGYRSGAKRAAAALASSKTAMFALTDLAIMLAEAGETAPALDCLERAFDERDPNMPYLGLWPFFRCLHGEPRYQALYRRLGLPEQA